MRIVTRIIVGWAADAPWIQEQRPAWEFYQVRLVTVPAQNHTSVNVAQPFLDRGWMCSFQPPFGHFLDEIPIVVRRCAVAGEDVMTCVRSGRQRTRPLAMIRVELRIGVSIGCAHA